MTKRIRKEKQREEADSFLLFFGYGTKIFSIGMFFFVHV